ncbi:hypothetical protein TRVL_03926 [Trypanosoma vivax]|nr:hypothetical protein TRVL_03926 [Trypanosoma vivax]
MHSLSTVVTRRKGKHEACAVAAQAREKAGLAARRREHGTEGKEMDELRMRGGRTSRKWVQVNLSGGEKLEGKGTRATRHVVEERTERAPCDAEVTAKHSLTA